MGWAENLPFFLVQDAEAASVGVSPPPPCRSLEGGIPVTDVEFTCPDNRGSRLPPSSLLQSRYQTVQLDPQDKREAVDGTGHFRSRNFGTRVVPTSPAPVSPLICIQTVIFFNSNFTPFFSPFFVSNDKHCVSRSVTESQPVPSVVGCIRALEGSHDGSINGGVGG